MFATSERFCDAPVDVTRNPDEFTHTVMGAVDTDVTLGGVPPMMAAWSGARTELCCETSCWPTWSTQSTTTASRLMVSEASAHET